jgi:hypothetical protein
MYEHEIRADAARERTARLSRDWPSTPSRRRVRLTLGRWLIGAGRRLAAESRAPVAHEALPRC